MKHSIPINISATRIAAEDKPPAPVFEPNGTVQDYLPRLGVSLLSRYALARSNSIGRIS
jgi:hypothetical protein